MEFGVVGVYFIFVCVCVCVCGWGGGGYDYYLFPTTNYCLSTPTYLDQDIKHAL